MSNDLTIIAIQNPLQAFSTPNGLDSIIDKIEAEAKSIDRDISTEAGRDNIRSLAFKLAKSKTFLDKMGKDLTEEQRAQITAVNAERKRAWERMEALQEEIRAPLTEWEQRDKRRIEAHEAVINLIVAARNDPFDKTAGLESDLIKARMDNLPALMNREWEEFSMKSIQEVDATRLHLETMYRLALKQEKDAAELARLRAEEEERRRIAHEEQIAAKARKEAEEKAAQAAEAERQRVEAAAQAERERVQREKDEAAAAAQKKLDDAETERKRIEQQRIDADERTRKAQEKAAADKAAMDKVLADALQAAEDAKAEALKKADAEKVAAIEKERKRVADEKAHDEKVQAERERNKAHQGKVNREAVTALIAIDHPALTEDLAKLIITAIAKGAISHVKISY